MDASERSSPRGASDGDRGISPRRGSWMTRLRMRIKMDDHREISLCKRLSALATSSSTSSVDPRPSDGTRYAFFRLDDELEKEQLPLLYLSIARRTTSAAPSLC
jgi:hypothetical protein